MKRRVAIIGGGPAGIAAAIRLAEAGWQPVLIEARKRLGGRASSIHDSRTGLLLDNCQHVLLGCCTNLLDFYSRLRVIDLIRWHRKLHWTKGHGLIDTLKAGLTPAPLHLARSLRRMQMFSAEEKRDIKAAMKRMVRMGAKGRIAWTGRTFAEFLEDCGQKESAAYDFWSTVIVSTCNLSVERVSAATAIQVFQDGFLGNRWSYTLGTPTVPLVELYDSAADTIEAAGGEVQLGATARSIGYDGNRVTGVVTSNGLVEAARVIAAVPPDRLSGLISNAMHRADTRLRELDRISFSPILGVHLLFDQKVMELPHLAIVDRPLHWLFNKGVGAYGRQHLSAVISAADEWMHLEEIEIIRRVIDDVHYVLPGARGIDPIEARAVKERHATFAPTPGVDEFRPSAKPGTIGLGGGGIHNLYLAGDWCDTGWPATMESAVRSGYAAAAAITGTGGVVEDIPPGWLARRLGLK
ncbi:MAG: FAD-dependent oxidoreductase [Phycisphaerales bacterium]|nr:MAG: FAD-dependent oxidoreductase [Phycisphaerales bacterium]